MQKIIENMSAQPATCVIASVLLFFFAALANYILMDGLLEMHRSKSALKKLKKQYTFFQKIRLLHFKGNCRHAVKFCNGMIIYQKIGWLCFAVYLLAGLLYAFDFFPAAVISWLSIAIFFVLIYLQLLLVGLCQDLCCSVGPRNSVLRSIIIPTIMKAFSKCECQKPQPAKFKFAGYLQPGV